MTQISSSVPAVSAGDVHLNPSAREWACAPAPDDVVPFHRGLDGYAPTPLRDLPELAGRWGVGRVLVKDESSRFGLPAFKALGVSFALYRLIRERAGRAGREVTVAGWDELAALVRSLPRFELITATDGNHGRAVARFARLIGVPAHVLVPDVVSPGAIDAIREEGATVTVCAEDYDATVRRAAELAAADEDAVLLQDTAWPGYEEVPQWIVDGYSTLLSEVDEQLADLGAGGPDLVVVPMGVGSFAQAVITHYRSGRGPRAALVGVEPDTAACIQASRVLGEPVSVATGSSIMAGLNCGTPSHLAWPALNGGLDAVVAVSETQAADAVRALGELGVSSGPCGAATLAGMETLLAGAARDRLGLDADATVVLLSTEGRPTAPAAGEETS